MTIKQFSAQDNPNYSFDVPVNGVRYTIEIYWSFWAFYCNVLLSEDGSEIIKGQQIIHGKNLFRYTDINATFTYVNNDGLDPTRNILSNGAFFLDDSPIW